MFYVFHFLCRLFALDPTTCSETEIGDTSGRDQGIETHLFLNRRPVWLYELSDRRLLGRTRSPPLPKQQKNGEKSTKRVIAGDVSTFGDPNLACFPRTGEASESSEREESDSEAEARESVLLSFLAFATIRGTCATVGLCACLSLFDFGGFVLTVGLRVMGRDAPEPIAGGGSERAAGAEMEPRTGGRIVAGG